jgi:Bifunctional DNA primase/polymerase, N-terminal
MSRHGAFNHFAERLVENGFTVIPTNGKQPATPRWQNPRATNLQWLRKMVRANRYAGCNVGIVCGRCVAIDIDAGDPVEAARLVALAVEHLGGTPFQRVGRSPRTLLLYKPLDEIPSPKVGCIEVLAGGHQFIAYGIHPATGRLYQWLDAQHNPATANLDTLPSITAQQVQAFVAAVGGSSHSAPTVGPLPAPRTVIAARHRARQGDMLDDKDRGIIKNAAGLVVDGRERFLAKITAAEYAKDKEASPDVLAGRVWARFLAEADVSRPKGSNPRKRWSHADALAKARAICRKRPDLKPPRRSRGGHPASQLASWRKPAYWTVEQRERHSQKVARRITTPATLAVANVMIEAVDISTGFCTMPIAEIAKRASCSTKTVKAARVSLRNSGSWIATRGVWIPVAEVLNRKQHAGRKREKPVTGTVEGASLYRCVVSASPKAVPVVSGSRANAPVDSAVASEPSASTDTIRRVGYQPDLFGAAVVDLAQFRRGRVPADLAAAVRIEMRARHITQDELAQQIGISQPQVANVLAGRFGLSPIAAARLLAWLQQKAA